MYFYKFICITQECGLAEGKAYPFPNTKTGGHSLTRESIEKTVMSMFTRFVMFRLTQSYQSYLPTECFWHCLKKVTSCFLNTSLETNSLKPILLNNFIYSKVIHVFKSSYMKDETISVTYLWLFPFVSHVLLEWVNDI